MEKLENIVPVLVQRRNGSLKDALEQIVEQLPDKHFANFLEPISRALENISEATAREKLVSQIALEFGAKVGGMREEENR